MQLAIHALHRNEFTVMPVTSVIADNWCQCDVTMIDNHLNGCKLFGWQKIGMCEILADPLSIPPEVRVLQRVDVSVINAQIFNGLSGRINDVAIFDNDVASFASFKILIGNGIPITAISQNACDSGLGCSLIYDVSLSGYYHIAFLKSIAYCQIDIPGYVIRIVRFIIVMTCR